MPGRIIALEWEACCLLNYQTSGRIADVSVALPDSDRQLRIALEQSTAI